MRNWLVIGISFFLSINLCAQTLTANQAQQSLRMREIEVNAASLVQYAGQGDWTTVQLLVQAGVSVIEPESVKGQTALHAAAAQGHDRMASEMLRLGIKPDAQDTCGSTPIINAAYAGRSSMVSLLLQNLGSLQVNHVAKCGLTPLIAAVLSGDARTVRVLLDANADTRLSDVHGITPVMAAQRKKRDDIVNLLTAP